jgi:1-acyl-sn-glycerol-3-phosphate acyltransferase
MSIAHRALTLSIKGITRLLCHIEAEALAQVPQSGPLILVCNHINFIEVPLLYTRLLPRPITGYAKSATWDSPILGPLFSLWGAIPIRRSTADVSAIKAGLQALEDGKIVGITPEGTRSGHGRLQRGHPGVVSLALHSRAPLLPLVYYGSETIHQNMRRLRRTDFNIKVGRPYKLVAHGERVTSSVRRVMTDEIMYQLARLLPPAYRGVYADVSASTTNYLQFTSGE